MKTMLFIASLEEAPLQTLIQLFGLCPTVLHITTGFVPKRLEKRSIDFYALFKRNCALHCC